MTQSLTDWLQQNRLVVVSVDPASRRVRLKGEAGVCTDLACAEQTVVVTDDTATGALDALNVGGADQPRVLARCPSHPLLEEVRHELVAT